MLARDLPIAIIFLLFHANSVCVDALQSSRILGGENAKQDAYPFVVALVSPNSKTDVNSATVLTHNWLLTDGWTCFLIGQQIQAHVGTVNLNKGGKIFQIEKYVMHPRWQESDDPGLVHPNDVCLLKLKEFLAFQPYEDGVNQVTLPPPDYDFPDGTQAVVMGWGTTTNDWHDVSNRLKIIRNMTAYVTNCPNSNLGGSPPFKGQFCAQSQKTGITTCSRDEGSPLVYNETIQMGINSWYVPAYPGAECSNSQASAYSKVSHYVNWIQTVLGDDAKNLKIASRSDVPAY